VLSALCALVPRPRRHLVTYHGVLAPAAGIRPRVVPRVEADEAGSCRHADGEGGVVGEEPIAVGGEEDAVRRLLRQRTVPHRPGKRRQGQARPRYSWAQLLARVFLIDVLLCPHCGGRRRLLASIHDPESIRRVLAAMGLTAEVPVLAAPRGPPAGEAWFGE